MSFSGRTPRRSTQNATSPRRPSTSAVTSTSTVTSRLTAASVSARDVATTVMRSPSRSASARTR